MAASITANTDWVTSPTNKDVQVSVHTTRIKPGHYTVWVVVYVKDEDGDWDCPEGTIQFGTINKDTNLSSSQQWVTNRPAYLGLAASAGFHPTLGLARYRMGFAALTAYLKSQEA